MARKVLALIEDTIGTKLLLASRLKALGYQITMLSALIAFRERVESDSFDWIILDRAALPPVRRRFLEHLQRHCKDARIVWCGKAPRGTTIPIEATFDKPLRYDDIERFFAGWISADRRGAAPSEDALPWDPPGQPELQPQSAGEGQKVPPHTGDAGKTTEGGGES